MFEERRIIGVVLPMVVRPGARHVEIDEFYALTVGSQFDLALGGGDDADDRFGVRIKGVG